MIIGNCRERIQSKLEQLTKTEAKLGSYILGHFEEILQYNVSELAKNAGVSDASVIRFCKNVGYKGYQDFKINAARDLLPDETQLNPILVKGDSDGAVATKIFGTYQDVLQRTLAGLDMDVITHAAEKIAKAGNIIMIGTGGSHMVALDASHKFLKMGIHTDAYDDADMQAMAASLSKPGDVMIVVSYTGSNYHDINCVKLAKENGAYTLGILGQGKSPLAKLVDDALYSASYETIFQSESLSNRIAQLAIFDVLVSCSAFRDYNRAYEAIQITRGATSANKY